MFRLDLVRRLGMAECWGLHRQAQDACAASGKERTAASFVLETMAWSESGHNDLRQVVRG